MNDDSNKKAKLSMEMDNRYNKSDVVNLRQREFGLLSPSSFAHRLSASQDLILRMELYSKLDKHKGCVNTISFSPGGDFLLSGSDDKHVIMWDWETGKVKLSFHSGHHNNVFQAKFMPFTEDRTIVTCAADGQIRVAHILERGSVETALLAKHDGRAHKLAVEPGSPYIFYTCGEDGLVQHIDLRTRAATKLFTCYSVNTRRGNPSIINLNAISIDPRNSNFFAVGGADEYARLFDIRKYKWDGSSDFGQPANYFCPSHLIGDGSVGITGLAFSDQSELLISYNDELIYLFLKDMGLGPDPEEMEMDIEPNPLSAASPLKDEPDEIISPQVYKGHKNCETVKGANFFGPRCEYVMSGSDCGRIFIWKKKSGELIRVMEGDKHIVNCLDAHPHSTVLASSGIETDVKIWTPKAIEKSTLPVNIEKVLLHRRFHCFAFDDDDDEGEDGDFLHDDLFEYTEDDDDNDEDDNADNDGESDNDDSDSDCDDDDDDDCNDNTDDDDNCNDNTDDDDDGNNATLVGANDVDIV